MHVFICVIPVSLGCFTHGQIKKKKGENNNYNYNDIIYIIVITY